MFVLRPNGAHGSNRLERNIIMKKKMICMLAGMLAVGMLSGCGADKATEEGPAVESSVAQSDASTASLESSGTGTSEGSNTGAILDAEKYVTLGDYKGLAVTVAAASVDDATLEAEMESMYFNYVTAENGGITDRAVADGDTVNIDYEGKKDDVAFDGGTAQGQSLTIGSGQFIDGFEEGLVGVMPGETVDLNLTFPEEYHSEELAGQAVVFTVTVNYIMPTEMEDAVVAEMGISGVSNLEELKQSVYDDLLAQAEANYASEVEYKVIEALVNNCTFNELPAEEIERCVENVRMNLEANASYYGLDGATMAMYFYGATDYETFLNEQGEAGLKQELAIQAVANNENISITDEELDTLLLETAQQYGLTTIEELIGDTDKSEYRSYFLYDKISDLLIENAVVSNE